MSHVAWPHTHLPSCECADVLLLWEVAPFINLSRLQCIKPRLLFPFIFTDCKLSRTYEVDDPIPTAILQYFLYSLSWVREMSLPSHSSSTPPTELLPPATRLCGSLSAMLLASSGGRSLMQAGGKGNWRGKYNFYVPTHTSLYILLCINFVRHLAAKAIFHVLIAHPTQL